MQKPILPLSVLNNLRCAQCERFISCSPVYVTPSDRMLCGRCKIYAKEMYRNVSYEVLASMFQYNCSHWETHCPKVLQWNECLLHEKECSYDSCCSRFWRHPCLCCRQRREIPLGEIRLVSVTDDLLDDLKCAICNCYLSCEKIYILPNGRNICHRCVYSNGPPPDGIQNVYYETLANILIFPCTYKNSGCATRMKFGTDLWHHEAYCKYNPASVKHQNRQYAKGKEKKVHKEKGVIQTHSGHFWGTITPNSTPPPFAPPKKDEEFNVTRQLVKSLKKHQERRHIRAEDIESQFDKLENSSTCTDESYRNGYERESSSGASTPSRFEEEEIQRHFSFLDRPDFGDSGCSINTNNTQPLPNREGRKHTHWASMPEQRKCSSSGPPLPSREGRRNTPWVPVHPVLRTDSRKQSFNGPPTPSREGRRNTPWVPAHLDEMERSRKVSSEGEGAGRKNHTWVPVHADQMSELKERQHQKQFFYKGE